MGPPPATRNPKPATCNLTPDPLDVCGAKVVNDGMVKRRLFFPVFGLLVVACAAALHVAMVHGQPAAHDPTLTWIRATTVESGDWKWSEADKGHLSGTLNFSARRPSQPVVVYLLRLADEGDAAGEQGLYDTPERLKVGQAGARFEPSFAVLVRGQTVEFLNDERNEISHNVYFLGDIETDLGIFDRGESREYKFEQYGEISVHCSIHKRMDGRMFIAPNPAHVLVPGDENDFRIRDIPAGRYRLLTWQRQKRFRDASMVVEIKAGETTEVAVEMSR
jgi:plastocyanin